MVLTVAKHAEDKLMKCIKNTHTFSQLLTDMCVSTKLTNEEHKFAELMHDINMCHGQKVINDVKNDPTYD